MISCNRAAAIVLGALAWIGSVLPVFGATFPIIAIDVDTSTQTIVDSTLQLPGPVATLDIGIIVDARGTAGIGDVVRIPFGVINSFNTGGATVTGVTLLSITDIIPPSTTPNNATFTALSGEFQFGAALTERGLSPNSFSGGPVRYALFRLTFGSLPAGSQVRVFIGDRGPGSASLRGGTGADISGDASPDGTPVTGVPGLDEGAGAGVDYRDGIVTFGTACADSQAPQCGGGCPTGQECVSDLAGQSCRCVTGPVSCSGSAAPECDGECPPGQLCAVSSSGTSCLCLGLPSCGQAEGPQCAGVCPSGEECVVATGGSSGPVCACEPLEIHCEDAGTPVCGGDCPTGYECQVNTTGNACVCEPASVPCDTSPWPQCGGSCPAGTQCRIATSGSQCICAPLDQPCGQSAYPTCGGLCPDGQLCGTQASPPSCLCQALSCETSPYPECGGSCAAGSICRSDASGACICQPEQSPCGQSVAPQCGGSCPAGELCESDRAGTSCQCEPRAVPCTSAAAPTCGGDCPVGEECIPTSTGSACYCSAPVVTCGGSAWPQCGGFCNEGEQCQPMLTGGGCACVPFGPSCEQSSSPVCGGFCSVGQQCEPQSPTGSCDCVSCTGAVPRGAIEMAWASPTHLVWTGLECASSYNLYRATLDGLVDADSDGLADDYGGCLMPNLTSAEADDTSSPPPGFSHFYLITAENANGEGALTLTSAGLSRPNRSPCP